MGKRGKVNPGERKPTSIRGGQQSGGRGGSGVECGGGKIAREEKRGREETGSDERGGSG